MGIIDHIMDHIMASPTTLIKPALTPPPGIVSNFDNPPSQSYAIIIAIVFFLVSTTSTKSFGGMTVSDILPFLAFIDQRLGIECV